MSALHPKADIVYGGWNVRFVPKPDSCSAAKGPYSITSSDFEYRLNLRSKTIHSGDNSKGDPGGDEAVFNAIPGSFWTNVKVGRLQAAALLILK